MIKVFICSEPSKGNIKQNQVTYVLTITELVQYYMDKEGLYSNGCATHS